MGTGSLRLSMHAQAVTKWRVPVPFSGVTYQLLFADPILYVILVGRPRFSFDPAECMEAVNVPEQ